MSEDESSIPNKKSKFLSDVEKEERIQKNREKAAQIRKAKMMAQPITVTTTNDTNIIKCEGVRLIDTGGGFLIEDTAKGSDVNFKEKPVEVESIELPITHKECLDCNDKFPCSYLYDNFDYPVCDACKELKEEDYTLVTRTESKEEYLLKDCDLDKREPILKFIAKTNPHNSNWGQMKLYLRCQVEKRALEVWGSVENILKERELREEKKEKMKVKKYNKQLKALRMDVRSSLYDKTKTETHTHKFGPETYKEEDDIYTHTCEICNFVEEYEKM